MIAKILVIEDSDALRKDIVEMLSFEGFEVRGAANGRIGVDMAREYHPDLIVCDIMMPELDGYGVLAELQPDGAGVTIPFIFLTAKMDKVDIRQGMTLGADDYVTKPFTVSDLVSSIRKRLEKREKSAQIAERKLEDLRDSIILSLPHELRTPLTGILGFSDMLMTDSEFMQPSQVAEMSRYVYDAAQRLYRLTENYLMYAHLELMLSDSRRAATLLQSTTPTPKALIEDIAIQKAQRHQRENDFSMSVSDAVVVNVFEDCLKKIIEELVDNAFKFSLPGKRVELVCETLDSQYRISVLDEGRGMKNQQVYNVGALMQFERKAHEQQGSGFGLAIVRKWVELYGGDLHIESVPDHHTLVTVLLPATPTGENVPQA